jgi:hypothetical protein
LRPGGMEYRRAVVATTRRGWAKRSRSMPTGDELCVDTLPCVGG